MKIEINASFGSRFQMKTGTETLLNFVNSWVVFFNNAHKKNKVKVVFSDTYNKDVLTQLVVAISYIDENLHPKRNNKAN